MENRGEISHATVKEWDAATKGKKLPEKVSHAAAAGAADALERFGFKTAAEEIRLQIPRRKFHGMDAAFRDKDKKMAGDADGLAALLDSVDDPDAPSVQDATRDPLDRATAWGAPSNLSAGDTASRLSDMGQPGAVGAVF